MRTADILSTKKILTIGCALLLAAGPTIAHDGEREVPVPTGQLPEFLTPLNEAGFIVGQSDAIPEITSEAASAFFGDRRMRVLHDATLAEQLMDAISGPPFDQLDLENGYYGYVACRAHSCEERGAVVMDRTGRIVAAELIGYRCRQGLEPDCDDMPVAYAFVDADLSGTIAERVFLEWAGMSFDEVDETNREYFPELPPVERLLRIVAM